LPPFVARGWTSGAAETLEIADRHAGVPVADLYVKIEISSTSSQTQACLAKALRALRELDSDFGWPERPWWHKPPDRARALVARTLSRHGLTGRLSLEPHLEGTAFDAEPPARWTGFTAKKDET